MSNYITGTDYNAQTGFFEITTTDATGATNTQSVSFSTLCMIFSLSSLQAQDEVFATQFEDASEQVTTLTMINDCMQMLNKYSTAAQDNGDDPTYLDGVVAIVEDGDDYVYGDKDTSLDGLKSVTYQADNGETRVMYYEAGSDADKWLNTYRPALVESGLVQDGAGAGDQGIGLDCKFNESELSAIMDNLQTAQTTISSQNEQQMLVTNDAASKRSTILQLAQSLMQQAADSRKSAAQS